MFTIYVWKGRKRKEIYTTSGHLQRCIELGKGLEREEGVSVTVETNGADDPKVYYKTMGVI